MKNHETSICSKSFVKWPYPWTCPSPGLVHAENRARIPGSMTTCTSRPVCRAAMADDGCPEVEMITIIWTCATPKVDEVVLLVKFGTWLPGRSPPSSSENSHQVVGRPFCPRWIQSMVLFFRGTPQWPNSSCANCVFVHFGFIWGNKKKREGNCW